MPEKNPESTALAETSFIWSYVLFGDKCFFAEGIIWEHPNKDTDEYRWLLSGRRPHPGGMLVWKHQKTEMQLVKAPPCIAQAGGDQASGTASPFQWPQNKSRFVTYAGSSGEEEERLPGEESPEALLELLSDPHSPWALPPGCSPEDQRLRDVAVLAPQLTRGTRVLQLFRSLRIVGKDVEEVDKDLLQLQHLEELTLCANQISRITSANLPRTLKVLELCCNAVADLEGLCAQPPPELQHLGLGYNRLHGPLQDKRLTADFWPNLISLDLSFNNLTDLFGLVSQLSSLKKLRILVLQGNPLALIPAYRGFIVDSLPKLSVLDDIHIELEERYQFCGLSKQPELIRSEAQVVVSIGKIKGVPDPSTLQELEVGSEAPVITYSYCVTYEFSGEEVEDGGTEVTEVKNHQSPVVATQDVDSSARDVKETKGQQECAAMEDPVAHTGVFVTPGMPWADTIDCSYRKEHTAKDLVGLKDYLRAGTIVSVVEEKVLWWPVSTDSEENAVKSGKEREGLKKDSTKGPGHRDKEKKKKKKKKKKEKPCELRSDPPIRRILGSGRVALEALLASETLVATVCDFGILITEQRLQPPNQEEKLDKKKGKDKSKKTKAEKEGQKATVPAKGKRKNRRAAEQEEGCELQPVPLTVEFQMQLIRWPAAAAQHRESGTEAAGKAQ
ncbi:leucine-rich repeat-containing protein 43 isoform X2 [Numida meleagris]|uniref:leucine-rich repeat-containing protein 43 isoform X2 n=1 Tax=Numida meleagris TaxID=8996 RepID=UPI000B3DD472|nr:leucine-rich repeat-containing protein 43 isoform X2 [Numida meleagris]